MLSFEASWVFYLSPIPLLILWLLPKSNKALQAINVPNIALWDTDTNASQISSATPWFNYALLWAIWGCLIIGAANPVWYGEPVIQESKGRDILLAVDISGSMRLEDMTLHGRRSNRLQASKSVISDFVKNRQGDRLGLILFGSNAYMHVPLTADTKTLTTLLNEAQIGYAGRETAIGDAIGLGLKRLHDLEHDERIMILLTDGSNSAGQLDPIEAAKLAAEQKLKIYTIGVGSRQGLRSGFGLRPSGGIDESTLQTIASISQGQFFTASHTEQLQEIYQYIDELEPTPDEATAIRPQKSLAWWLVGAAVLLNIMMALSNIIRYRGAH